MDVADERSMLLGVAREMSQSPLPESMVNMSLFLYARSKSVCKCKSSSLACLCLTALAMCQGQKFGYEALVQYNTYEALAN